MIRVIRGVHGSPPEQQRPDQDHDQRDAPPLGPVKDPGLSDGHPVSLKADRSVVTQADIEADHLIRSQIQREYPGEQLLSEEHEQILEDLSSPVWIIDPLDGTTNFSLGLPIWGVLITRLVNGYPDTAVCYFPLVSEIYTSQRHAGAFLNNLPIHTRPPEKEQPASFFSCCSRTFRRYDVSVPYKTRILGSSGYTFCAVARGAAVLGFEATPKIWDLAACVPSLHREAGDTTASLVRRQH